MHCSDQELLARLDGELSALRSYRVARHLKSCWSCRTRSSALEEQIHKLSVEMDEWPMPPPEWRAAARARLGARLLEEESVRGERRIEPRRVATVAAWAAACLLLGFVGWQWTRPRPRALVPTDVIEHARAAEDRLFARPVEQVFSVRISQLRPTRKVVDSRLQVWSDGAGGRFASKLSAPGGALKQALWKPDAGREYVYHGAASTSALERPGHADAAPSLSTLADRGLDPEQIESAFMRWLEARAWSPISFARQCALWAAEDGTVAAAENVRGPDGAQAIRISARKRTNRVIAVLSVDVDSTSFHPKLQTIRFETPDSAVELNLEAATVRTLGGADLSQSLFQPSPEFMPAANALAVRREPREPLPPASPRRLEEGWPPLDPREIEALFALHQAGACLGAPVRVVAEGDGARVVPVGSDAAGYHSDVGLEFLLPALAEMRGDKPELPASNESFAASLRHAWALRRLSAHFAGRRTPPPDDPAGVLLAAMVHDHSAAIRQALESAGIRGALSGLQVSRAADWRRPASAVYRRLSEASSGPVKTTIDKVFEDLAILDFLFPTR